MEIILTLNKDKEFSINAEKVYDSTFDIMINYKNNNDLISILNDKENLLKNIIDTTKNNNKSEIEIKEIEELYYYLKKNFDKMYDDVTYVHIDLNKELLNDINNNPILKDKKIAINKKYRISDIKEIDKIISNYSEYKYKINFDLINNLDYINIDEVHFIDDCITKITDNIKELNLSPIEKIMYAYDIVKERIYKETNNKEWKKSRQILSIFKDDKIVCSGYVALFNTILDKLGIKAYKSSLSLKEDPDDKHCRSIMHVKDSKYNIDGIYYFDPTWNSKIDTNDNTYHYRYDCFCKTDSQMQERSQNIFNNESFKINNDVFEEIISLIKNDSNIVLMTKYGKDLNLMLELLKEESLKLFDENKLERVKNIFQKLNSPLSAETMIKICNEVKKIEATIDSSIEYNISELFLTLCHSEWEFDDIYISKSNYVRLTQGKFKKQSQENFLNYIESIGLDKDIETYNNKIKTLSR